MNNMVVINGKEVERIEYKNQPVVTLKMVDELHERPADTARRTFTYNKKQLVEKEDYFNVPHEEWKEFLVGRNSSDQKGGHRGDITFLTQTGYLMLVKSFNDDLAWKVQRHLVNRYFEKPGFYFRPEHQKQKQHQLFPGRFVQECRQVSRREGVFAGAESFYRGQGG